MRHLQWVLWAIGLGLQYLVLASLMRGRLREFRLIFVYVFLLLATTIADIAWLYTIGRNNTFYPKFYWAAELTRQSGLFAVVVSLVLDVLPEGRRKRATLNLVFAGAVLFWMGSLAFTWQPDLNAWMTKVVRNLSFGSAVLDMGLWFTLIASGSRDMTRLLIAGGLGLQMTGEAIGQSIRHLFPHSNTLLAGFLLTVLAHFLCLLIWRYAFARDAPRRGTADVPAVRSRAF